MTEKNPLLSWLFGHKREENPQEEQGPVQLREEPARAAPDAGQEMGAPFQLTLPRDHAVYRLLRLWQDEAGRQPSPRFSLRGPEDNGEAVGAAQAKQELARLLLTVNASANQRLGKAVPGKNEKAGEDPPAPPKLDACAVAVVSASRLAAWVFAYPPVGGGKGLSREMLSQALREKQVVHGVDEALLEAIPGRP